MKRNIIALTLFFSISFLFLVPAAYSDGPPPPPPGHFLNGNQTSPGGTGCPIDRTEGMLMTVILCLVYAGFVLYRRSKQQTTAE
jgi:hypothetical protein